jgi:hypothetical protein
LPLFSFCFLLLNLKRCHILYILLKFSAIFLLSLISNCLTLH